LAKQFKGDLRVLSQIIYLDPELDSTCSVYWRTRFSWTRLFKTAAFILLFMLALIGLVSLGIWLDR
jgi:hypothetical protein